MSSLPTVKAANLGGKAATVNKTRELGDQAKWVQVQALDWTDEDGKDRVWEVASRKTTGKGGIDAVAIAAILKHPSRPLSIPIILQYRPPAKSICVELPAGLIDGDESPETAAIRELKEETGYEDSRGSKFTVLEVGGTTPSDPGMTTANMSLVTVLVELQEGEEEPKPKLDEGEHIEVRLTPLNELYSHLKAYEQQHGYSVDARLHHFAAGIELAKNHLM